MVIGVLVLVGRPAILPSFRVLIESGGKFGGKEISRSWLSDHYHEYHKVLWRVSPGRNPTIFAVTQNQPHTINRRRW